MKRYKYIALMVFAISFLVTSAMLTLANPIHRCYNIVPQNNNNCDLTVSGTSGWLIAGNPGVPDGSTIPTLTLWDVYVKIRAWDNASTCPAPIVEKDVCKTPDFNGAPTCDTQYAYFEAKPPGTDYYTTKHKWYDDPFGDSFYTSPSGAHGTYEYWVGQMRTGCPSFGPE